MNETEKKSSKMQAAMAIGEVLVASVALAVKVVGLLQPKNLV